MTRPEPQLSADAIRKKVFDSWMRSRPMIAIPDRCMEVDGVREWLDEFAARSICCAERQHDDAHGVWLVCLNQEGGGHRHAFENEPPGIEMAFTPRPVGGGE